MVILYFAEKYHGVVLIPEGLVDTIPELYALLKVCNSVSVSEIMHWFCSLKALPKYTNCTPGNSWTT
jgi:hypothetical protein